MTTAKEYRQHLQHDIKIDVEEWLQAIDKKASGRMQEYMDAEPMYQTTLKGMACGSCAELAESFELDIHDIAFSEVNR